MIDNEIDCKTIGRRISYYRKRKKLTQAQFAGLLQVSESYVSQMECGKTKISLSMIYKMARILDVKKEWFISDELITEDNIPKTEFEYITEGWSNEQLRFGLEMLRLIDKNYKADKKE